jgi:DNA-binding beta-propeller fold protein YncE
VVAAVIGVGIVANFNNPASVTTDGTNLYIADTNNQIIRKVVIATGEVSLFVGTGADGSSDTAPSFSRPEAITTDGTYLYVMDTDNQTLRRITIADGNVITLAGVAGQAGGNNGTANVARFYLPSGIVTDGKSLFISDTANNAVRKME